jgi:hypothetical protein
MRPPVSIPIGDRLLPQVVSFNYLGVFFDAGLRWRTQTRYVQKRYLTRTEFFEIDNWRLVRCTLSLHDYVV